MAITDGPEPRLGLAVYLMKLQAELSKARSLAERGEITFSMEAVTLELDICCSLPNRAAHSAAPEFWVAKSAPQDGKDCECQPRYVQRITLKLMPMPAVVDEPVPSGRAPEGLPPSAYHPEAG